MNKFAFHLLSVGGDIEIRILMRQTARAFEVDVPKTAGLSTEDILRRYAIFTADESARAIWGGRDQQKLRRDLYRMAYRLGSSVRLLLRPRDDTECFSILTVLYRNIGIDIAQDSPGDIRVDKCYFSDFYTPGICSLISAIDKGIFAGVCHRGKLKFRERITGGSDACRAKFG